MRANAAAALADVTRCWHRHVPGCSARQGESAGGAGGQGQVIAHDRALPLGLTTADTDDRG
jgi:hypothetical protein